MDSEIRAEKARSLAGRAEGGKPASIAIDTGSRGVLLGAGTFDMQELIWVPREQATASPAIVSGETVVLALSDRS